MPARRHVHLRTTRFRDMEAFLDAMRAATDAPGVDFVEGLFYSADRLYLTVSRFVDNPPRVDDILRDHVFYRLVEEREDVYLTTKDYLFRYDPEWFWNLPDTTGYRLVQREQPARLCRSASHLLAKNAIRLAVGSIIWRAADSAAPAAAALLA